MTIDYSRPHRRENRDPRATHATRTGTHRLLHTLRQPTGSRGWPRTSRARAPLAHFWPQARRIPTPPEPWGAVGQGRSWTRRYPSRPHSCPPPGFLGSFRRGRARWRGRSLRSSRRAQCTRQVPKGRGIRVSKLTKRGPSAQNLNPRQSKCKFGVENSRLYKQSVRVVGRPPRQLRRAVTGVA